MKISQKYFLLGLLIIITACAKIATPTGGPEDKTPPKALHFTFVNEAKNISTNLKELKIGFDEYVILKNPQEQILISPPMENSPAFEPAGSAKKYIAVQFKESLHDNTTYTINFGNSIQDNNVGNPLGNFMYVFSTGDQIDSLKYEGNVKKMNISSTFDDKIILALYKKAENFTDSTVFKQKPYYITRPDSTGLFEFKYLAQGTYALYAISDQNKNLKYNPGIDEIAFIENDAQLPQPNDSITNTLILFKEKANFKLKNATHEAWGKIRIETQGNPEAIQIRDIDKPSEKFYQTYSPKHDSTYYWYIPTAQDSIKKEVNDKFQLEISYQGKIIDTLTCHKRTSFRPSKLKAKELIYNDDFAPLTLETETLIQQINENLISIRNQKKEKINFKILKDSLNKFRTNFVFDKKYKEDYQIEFLPNALEDIFGKKNIDTLKFQHKTQEMYEYGILMLKIENKPDGKFWLYLYKDQKIFRELYTDATAITFRALPTGNYSMKYIADTNQNRIWDTGDLLQKKQPEPIYYNEKEIYIRNNYEEEYHWDLTKSEIGAPLTTQQKEKNTTAKKKNTLEQRGKSEPKTTIND